MAESSSNQVGLFIDWDNLAISTAADLGGAAPDIKRIVHKAQEYGQVVIARAYAEWNTMSERLAVYRAGIEPVYAPTFRFETDPVTQLSRGKSLADPVMVADCIDSLHILPQMSVYVVVTGDKDMIPVVRLAQLRGKKVVIIGPDLVAGVLREMADEFISYRTLVQTEGSPAPARQHEPPAIVHRRPQPGRAPAPVRPVAPARPVTAPAPVRVPEAEKEAEAVAPEMPALSEVFSALVDILHGLADSGRVKVRATNLKDQLLLRMPGFSERKYGFSKFKDLLLAAERSALVTVSAAGPVHWVSLPAVEQPAPEPVQETIATRVAPASVEQAPAINEAELAEQARGRRLAVVRFIDELRQRSRWLTYTYVLTNVIGFIGRIVSPGEAEAEAEARSILSQLVAEDALRIDKVPQEVDVGGIKHRVRMCHFVEDHPFVREARAVSLDELPAELRGELQAAAAAEVQPEAEPARVEAMTPEQGPTSAGEPSLELATADVAREEAFGGNGKGPAEAAEPRPEAEESELPAGEELWTERPRSRTRRGRRRGKSAAAARAEQSEAEGAASVTEAAAAERQETSLELLPQVEMPAEVEAPRSPAAELAVAQAEAETPAATEPEPEVAPAAEQPAIAGPALVPTPLPKPTREEVFAAVRRIVSEQTSLGKARLTGSSLKLRLGRVFPGFDERELGYTKFKDFLRAAEATGAVQVSYEGQVSWVRLPSEPAEERPVEAPVAAFGADLVRAEAEKGES